MWGREHSLPNYSWRLNLSSGSWSLVLLFCRASWPSNYGLCSLDFLPWLLWRGPVRISFDPAVTVPIRFFLSFFFFFFFFIIQILEYQQPSPSERTRVGAPMMPEIHSQLRHDYGKWTICCQTQTADWLNCLTSTFLQLLSLSLDICTIISLVSDGYYWGFTAINEKLAQTTILVA
jgi:hypothetical protein